MKTSMRQTTSGKKPRAKQKKSHEKFDAKKPKKPPTHAAHMRRFNTMYDIATEKRAEFERVMTEYNKRMENSEYEETDEESDFDG